MQSQRRVDNEETSAPLTCVPLSADVRRSSSSTLLGCRCVSLRSTSSLSRRKWLPASIRRRRLYPNRRREGERGRIVLCGQEFVLVAKSCITVIVSRSSPASSSSTDDKQRRSTQMRTSRAIASTASSTWHPEWLFLARTRGIRYQWHRFVLVSFLAIGVEKNRTSSFLSVFSPRLKSVIRLQLIGNLFD